MRRLCCTVNRSSGSSAINLSNSRLPRSHHNFSCVFLVDHVSFRSVPLSAFKSCSYDPKVAYGLDFRPHGFCWKRKIFHVDAMDEGSFGFSSFDDWDNNDAATDYVFSSSDGDDSDGDITLQPITDVDLPTTKEHFRLADESITITAHRFAVLGRAQRKRKTIYGLLNNVGIVAFLTMLLLLVDCCAWKIVRLPLAPFYLLRPFLVSTGVVSIIGYIWVPLFRSLKHRSIVRKEGSSRHSYKKVTPTMGGLYFIPAGIAVAVAHVGFSSKELFGASAVTLAFAAIGLLGDLTGFMNKRNGYSSWIRIILEVKKMVVPLPAPLGLVCCRSFYLLLTSISFLSMADGVSLTDGLDGLTGGIAALAFIGMSIVVLPICADIAAFGSSMAGACVGFLFQNRYKTTIYMGDTGSLALGGALASMAACTGMFSPLLISSALFLLEALSVALQECPVCKALIEEEKLVPLYGRGKNSTDPRSKSIPGLEIPRRPAGQRPETAPPPPPPDANAFAHQGFGFTGGFGGFAPMAHARFGNFTLSAAFGGLIPSLFNIQVHGFPDASMYGAAGGFPYGYTNMFHGGAHGFPQRGSQQQQADFTLKLILLVIAVFVLLALMWN